MERYTRQLVFLSPDVFLIYDRVTTTSSQETKRFLLHTVTEPEVQGKPVRTVDVGIQEFDSSGDIVVTDDAARMFVRSLLPRDGLVRRIGGVHVNSLRPGATNRGDGAIEDLRLLPGACTETITLTCTKPGPDAEFKIVSNVFGRIGTATAGTPFTDDPRHPQYPNLKLDPHLAGLIKSGRKLFAEGDTFTIELQSYRFWTEGQNLDPSLGWWTSLGNSERPAKARQIGGWGRIEIEPRQCRNTDHFLTVLYCAEAGTKAMPSPCSLLEEPGTEGVKLSQGNRDYEVRFRSNGLPGGRIRVWENGKSVVDRTLAKEVVKKFSAAP
jgi:hypothetical protein